MQKGNVTLSVNEYEIEMLEIKTGKFTVFISLKKAVALIETQHDVSLIKTVNKYNRELFEITYKGTKKSFSLGINKANAVLDNQDDILLILNAQASTQKLA